MWWCGEQEGRGADINQQVCCVLFFKFIIYLSNLETVYLNKSFYSCCCCKISNCNFSISFIFKSGALYIYTVRFYFQAKKNLYINYFILKVCNRNEKTKKKQNLVNVSGNIVIIMIITLFLNFNLFFNLSLKQINRNKRFHICIN